jgi:hypothetical protein
MDKKWTMEGEKSEQGIVVNKLVGNATKISDHGRKAIRTYLLVMY